jgi:hypothetical protein
MGTSIYPVHEHHIDEQGLILCGLVCLFGPVATPNFRPLYQASAGGEGGPTVLPFQAGISFMFWKPSLSVSQRSEISQLALLFPMAGSLELREI